MTQFFFKISFMIALGLANSLFGSAEASPENIKRGADGKFYVEKHESLIQSRQVECGNLSVNVMAGLSSAQDQTPSAMALIAFGERTARQAFRVFDITDGRLQSAHNTNGLKLGCLSQDGGVGIYIPHANGDEKALFIQIDNEGMVHFGYNLISLELMEGAAE